MNDGADAVGVSLGCLGVGRAFPQGRDLKVGLRVLQGSFVVACCGDFVAVARVVGVKSSSYCIVIVKGSTMVSSYGFAISTTLDVGVLHTGWFRQISGPAGSCGRLMRYVFMDALVGVLADFSGCSSLVILVDGYSSFWCMKCEGT